MRARDYRDVGEPGDLLQNPLREFGMLSHRGEFISREFCRLIEDQIGYTKFTNIV
jgi:hypothetical protein